MPTRRSVLTTTATGALAAVLAGCSTAGSTMDKTSASAGGTASGSGSVASSTSITIGSFPMGNSMDPWSSMVSNFTSQAVYDTLTRIGADGKVGPWLATSWTYTDAKTLTLKLRDDVTFTDGSKLDARVVKANLEHGMEVNPKNFGSGPYLASIDSVDATDATTVTIHLKEANPDLPYAFSGWAGYIVSGNGLEDATALTSTPQGSGAYVLDAAKTTAGDTYTFTPNPNYWAAGQVKRFGTVVVKIMNDPTAMANAAQAGSVDYMATPDPTVQVGSLTKAYGGPVSILGFAFQDLQGKISKPLADVKVRQAMNYAIDRQSILDNVMGGAGVVNGSTPFGPSSAGYTTALDSHYTYDPDKAKQLLSEAGYADGFTVKVLVNGQFAKIAQAMADQLRKVGIETELSSHSTDIMAQTSSGDWAMATLVTSVTGQPFTDVTGTVTAASVYNPQKNTDAKITELLAAASEASDEAAASTAYEELATYIQGQALMLTPVLFKTGYAYNAAKIAISAPETVIYPDLWYLSPTS